jgi:peptidyl-prolyl cis-trans isomerase C
MSPTVRAAALLAAVLMSAGVWAQGNYPGDAVRVNGVAISHQRFAGFYQEYLRTKGVSASTPGFNARRLDTLRSEAMDRMIEQELVRQAAERAGIGPDAPAVDARIAELREKFDTDLSYDLRLESEGFTPKSYRAHVAGLLAGAQYVEGIRAAVPLVTDAELEQYYRDNERRLTYPEEVRVRHILLTWKRLGSGDDKAAIRGQMTEILAQARGGADFAALARERSEDRDSAPQGGDIGFFHRGQRVPAFEDVAFALGPGEVSDMVETPFGVHILQLVDRRPEELLPLDEIREKLRDHVLEQRRAAAVKEEIARLRAAAKIEILVAH